MNQISEFVLHELKKSGIRVRLDKQRVWICCPYHHERTPSCSVIIEDKKYFPGTFHCFGCDESGGWNKLADKLHLKKLTKRNVSEDDPFYRLRDRLNSVVKTKEAKAITLPGGVAEWPESDKWKRFKPNEIHLPGKFLKSIGAYKWWDKDSESYRILFPAYMNGDLRGYVGGRLQKDVELRYKNSPGEWAKTTWLGYDYKIFPGLKKVWAKYNNESVVITEGPYSWAKTIYMGLPSLALLGVNNFESEKRTALCMLGVKNVILFCDGDKPGYEAMRKLNIELRKYMTVRIMRLPIMKKKNEQLDPGNCSEEYFDKIKSMLE